MSLGRLWPHSNMKALYHLSDENDSSGNAYNLTNSGTTTFVLGKFENCANFVASSSQKLQYSNITAPTNAPFTVMLWFNLNSLPGTNVIYGLFTNASNNGGCEYGAVKYQDVSGTKQFHVEPGSITHYGYVITLSTGVWYHLAYVNVDNATALTKLYLNGVEVASGNNSTNNVGTTYSSLGGSSSSSEYSNAKIDEAVFISAALSAADVRRYYAWATGKMV